MSPGSSARRARLRGAIAATVLVAAGALACTRAAAAADGGAEPRTVVKRTTDDVLTVLAQASLSTGEKRERIEAIIYSEVDFPTVSQLVLARNWTRFSEPQRGEFIEEFKKHLSRTYGRNVDNYKNERVDIVADRAETRGDWTVRTKILRGGRDDIAVDYRLRSRDGSWRIIDIIVEGVSLIANFRAQFQEIMAQGGPEHLLDLLRTKNLKSEPIT